MYDPIRQCIIWTDLYILSVTDQLMWPKIHTTVGLAQSLKGQLR